MGEHADHDSGDLLGLRGIIRVGLWEKRGSKCII